MDTNMHPFKDSQGTTWEVAINVSQLRAVKDLARLDILALVSQGDMAPLQDPINLCNVLYVLCRKTAQARGVSDEEFGERLFGDVIDSATEALMGEIVDFFPRQKRALLREALETD